jgi:hypothetical protein
MFGMLSLCYHLSTPASVVGGVTPKGSSQVHGVGEKVPIPRLESASGDDVDRLAEERLELVGVDA